VARHSYRPSVAAGPRPTFRTRTQIIDWRRERVARLWSGELLDGSPAPEADGRKWKAWQIADDLGIEVKSVFGHLAALRKAGDARAENRPQWANQARNRGAQ
jgi:hypothetical protein